MDSNSSPCPDTFASSSAGGPPASSAGNPPTSENQGQGQDQDQGEEDQDSDSSASTSRDLDEAESDDDEEEEKDALENFRQKWKDEVSSKKAVKSSKKRTSSKTESSGETELEETGDDFLQARKLFLEGVELERERKHFDAILKYKKAVQLVPDIEYRTFEYNRIMTSMKENEKEDENENNFQTGTSDPNGNDEDDQIEDEFEGDLISKFTNLTFTKKSFCEQEFPSNSTHISALPIEVILVILKWVVSSELDLRSLERCALVSRGFFLVSRSSDLWRLICLNTWGMNHLPLKCPDWRNYFLTRPRLLLPGCYIARMTYAREGERSFQDHEFYRSWHMVHYFRYLRFFAGGKIIMLTTADEPQNAVRVLNQRNLNRVQGVMSGHYRFSSTNVVAGVVKKPYSAVDNLARMRGRRGKNNNRMASENPDPEFHFELEVRGKKFNQLNWLSYKVVHNKNSSADIDVSNQMTFPNLFFSRVQSYSNYSEAPLQ